MTFIFHEENKIEYGEDDFQFLNEKEIQVNVKLDNIFINLKTYEEQLRILSRLAISTLERDSNTKRRTTFLKEKEQRIAVCLNLFKVQDEYVFKKKCSFFWFEDSDIELTPIKPNTLREAQYIKLYEPFIRLQFQSIKGFKDEFLQIFGKDLKYRLTERKKPEFLYHELWRNSKKSKKLRKDLITIITKFRKELVSGKYITNKGNEAILHYFGLTAGDDKIRWEKGPCYFYTLNRLLERNQILTGHYNMSLEKSVTIKDWNDWDAWHSLKNVKNNELLLNAVIGLKENLEDLEKQYLQTTLHSF